MKRIDITHNKKIITTSVNDAKDIVEGICFEKLKNYKNDPHYKEVLKKELIEFDDRQCQWLLIVQKVLQDVKNKGHILFSRMRAGNSLVLFLLGITNIDPIQSHLNFDLFHYDKKKRRVLNFAFSTSLEESEEFICREYHMTLLKNENVYFLKKLLKKTNTDIASLNYEDHNLIENFLADNKWFPSKKYCTNSALGICSSAIIKYVKNLGKISSFNELVNGMAVRHGTNLVDSLCYCQQDEIGFDMENIISSQDQLLDTLLKCGLSKNEALKYSSERSIQYSLNHDDEEFFKSKNVNQDIIDFLKRVNYLIPKAHIINDVKVCLLLFYFKEKFPKEFYETILPTYIDETINIVDDFEKSISLEEDGKKILAYLLLMEMKARKIDFVDIYNKCLSTKDQIYDFEDVPVSFEEAVHSSGNFKFSYTIGKTENSWATLDLTENPIQIITGTSGSGKTVYINSLIAQLMIKNSYKELKLAFVDPKIVDTYCFDSSKYLYANRVFDIEKAIKLMNEIIEEAKVRKDLFKKSHVNDFYNYNLKNDTKLPLLIFVFMEFGDLYYSGDSLLLMNTLNSLLDLAKDTGICILLEAQRANPKMIDKETLKKIDTRVCFAVGDKKDSKVLLNNESAYPLKYAGEGILYNVGTNEQTHFRAPYISGKKLKEVIRQSEL